MLLYCFAHMLMLRCYAIFRRLLRHGEAAAFDAERFRHARRHMPLFFAAATAYHACTPPPTAMMRIRAIRYRRHAITPPDAAAPGYDSFATRCRCRRRRYYAISPLPAAPRADVT